MRSVTAFLRLRASALRLAGTLSSAVLIVQAFPPDEYRSVAWVALVPLLLAVRSAKPLEAAILAGIWGMIGAYGVTDWLPRAVAHYYQQPFWLGMMLFVVAAFCMGALDYMAFGAFYAWVSGRRSAMLPILAAAAWVAAELARARVLTGNPWGLLGYTQSGVETGDRSLGLLAGVFPLQLIQIADATGVYGVSFVLLACNAALTDLLWMLAARDTAHRKKSLAGAAAVLVLVLATFCYGALRLSSETAALGTPVRGVVVQGNLDLGSQWNETLYGRNLDVYLTLTQEAVARYEPEVVFWPENAMTFFVDDEPLYREAVSRVIGPPNVQLVAGAPRYVGQEPPIYFNSAFVLEPDGAITSHYDKEQLLPFAEYFPFDSLDYLRRSFARVRVFTPGSDNHALPTRAGDLGMMICNEAMFPRIARRRVRAGASVLVNLSNDTWIPEREFAEHQLHIVALRAVELRRELVRASTSGPSAFIDASGAITARTEPGTRAVLPGRILPRTGHSPYERYGDLFAWSCVAACLAYVIAGIVRPRTSK